MNRLRFATLATVVALTAMVASASARPPTRHPGSLAASLAAVQRYEAHIDDAYLTVSRCERVAAGRVRCTVTLPRAATACVQQSCVSLTGQWRDEVRWNGRRAQVRPLDYETLAPSGQDE